MTKSEIAAKAGVATSTVFALFKSKEGILRVLLEGALFGPRFQAAQAMLERIPNRQ